MESRVLLTDVVSLAVLDASASELSGDTGTFRISRSGTQGGLTVNFLVAASSTATVGTDYAPINGTVAFADGESWKDVTIAPVDDSVPEAMKNLSVSIVPAAAGEYIVGLQSSGTITIADDDTPGGLIRFNLTGTQSVTEAVTDSDNNLTTYTIGYTGTLSGSNTASVDIAHLFNQTGNSDYVTSLTTAITNAVANTPGTSFNGTTLRFGAPSNTVSSASRFAGAAVNAGGWANPALATGNTPGDFASIPLDDRDTSGDLRLTQFGFNIPSNATITGITASLNTTGSNTSRGGAGLKVTKDGSVAVGAPPISTTNWDTGSVVVGSNSSLWGTSWTPAEINSPNFGLIVNVRSDDDGYQFRVASANIVVSYTTPDGTAPSSITFSASIADDTTGEGSEAYTVALSNPVTTLPQGSTIANSSVTTTIVDNDVAFSITGLNSSITESTIDGDGNTARYVIGYTGDLPQGQTASVDIAHVFGQTVSSDFTASIFSSITSAAGATSGVSFDSVTGRLTFSGGAGNARNLTFSALIADDTIAEPAEAYQVTISNPVTANSLSTSILTSSASTTIISDDVETGGSFSITGTSSVTENPSDGDLNQVTYTIDRTGLLAAGQSASVDIIQNAGTTAATDFSTSLSAAISAAAATTPGVSFNGTTLTFSPVTNVSASSSKYAGTAVNAGGWLNPTNALGNTPSTYSSAEMYFGDSSGDLRLSNFGFSIPANATITGITTSINTNGSFDPSWFSGTGVRLTKNGASPVGNSLGSSTSWGSGTLNLGGNANLWGTSWTPAEINSSGFGVIINVISSDDPASYFVRSANIVVSYTVPNETVPTSLTFTASIADDTLVESPETFSVGIANPQIGSSTTGMTLGTSVVTTTILDNDVAPTNGAPIISGFDGTAVYPAGSAAILLDTDTTITDSDSPNFSGGMLTLQITANAAAGDVLAIRNEGTAAGQISFGGNNITRVYCGGIQIGTVVDGTAPHVLSVSLNASATPTIVQSLIRNVTYRSTLASPSTLPRTIQATLTDGNGGTSNQALKTVSVTSTVQTLPVVSLTAIDPLASELPGNTATFRVSRTDTSTAIVVSYSVMPASTAVAGVDYVQLTGSVAFAVGEAYRDIVITPLNDLLPESVESVQLSLLTSPLNQYLLGTTVSGTVSIMDDDPVSVWVSNTQNGTEGGTNPTITLQRNMTSGTLVATYMIAASSTAMQGQDYVPLSGTVTFASGAATATITLTVIDDTIIEAVESVSIQVYYDEELSDSYVVTPTGTGTVTITDNDVQASPTITISALDQYASESGQNPGVFRIFRSNASGTLTVAVAAASASTATPETDYVSIPGSVTFSDGESYKDIVVTPLSDSESESAEVVILNILQDVSGTYLAGSPNSAVVTIMNQLSTGAGSVLDWQASVTEANDRYNAAIAAATTQLQTAVQQAEAHTSLQFDTLAAERAIARQNSENAIQARIEAFTAAMDQMTLRASQENEILELSAEAATALGNSYQQTVTEAAAAKQTALDLAKQIRDQQVAMAEADFDEAVDTATETLNAAKAEIEAAYDSAIAAAEAAYESAITAANAAYDNAAQIALSAANAAIESAVNGYNAAVDAAKAARDLIIANLYESAPSGNGDGTYAAGATPGSPGATITFNPEIVSADAAYNAAVASAETVFNTKVDEIINDFRDDMNQANEDYDSAVEVAGNQFNDAVGAADQKYDDDIETAISTHTDQVTTAVSTFDTAVTEAQEKFNTKATEAEQQFNQTVQTAETDYNNAVTSANNTYQSETGAATNTWNQFKQVDGPQQYADVIQSASTEWVNSVVEAIRNAKTGIPAAQNDHVQVILAKINEILPLAIQTADAITSGYDGEIQGVQAKANESTIKYLDVISQPLGNFTDPDARNAAFRSRLRSAILSYISDVGGRGLEAAKSLKLSLLPMIHGLYDKIEEALPQIGVADVTMATAIATFNAKIQEANEVGQAKFYKTISDAQKDLASKAAKKKADFEKAVSDARRKRDDALSTADKTRSIAISSAGKSFVDKVQDAEKLYVEDYTAAWKTLKERLIDVRDDLYEAVKTADQVWEASLRGADEIWVSAIKSAASVYTTETNAARSRAMGSAATAVQSLSDTVHSEWVAAMQRAYPGANGLATFTSAWVGYDNAVVNAWSSASGSINASVASYTQSMTDAANSHLTATATAVHDRSEANVTARVQALTDDASASRTFDLTYTNAAVTRAKDVTAAETDKAKNDAAAAKTENDSVASKYESTMHGANSLLNASVHREENTVEMILTTFSDESYSAAATLLEESKNAAAQAIQGIITKATTDANDLKNLQLSSAIFFIKLEKARIEKSMNDAISKLKYELEVVMNGSTDDIIQRFEMNAASAIIPKTHNNRPDWLPLDIVAAIRQVADQTAIGIRWNADELKDANYRAATTSILNRQEGYASDRSGSTLGQFYTKLLGTPATVPIFDKTGDLIGYLNPSTGMVSRSVLIDPDTGARRLKSKSLQEVRDQDANAPLWSENDWLVWFGQRATNAPDPETETAFYKGLAFLVGEDTLAAPGGIGSDIMLTAEIVTEAAGLVDPTGIADIANAGIHLANGNRVAAGVAVAGILMPFGVEKLGKYAHRIPLTKFRQVSDTMVESGARASNKLQDVRQAGNAVEQSVDSMKASTRCPDGGPTCFIAGTQVLVAVLADPNNQIAETVPKPAEEDSPDTFRDIDRYFAVGAFVMGTALTVRRKPAKTDRRHWLRWLSR